MKVCIFGCGHLGLTTACALAHIGHDVYCIENNDYKISNLKQGIIDFYEPDLNEFLIENIKENRLRFYDSYTLEPDTDIFIVAVDTYENNNGELVVDNVRNSILSVITSVTKYCAILVKTTIGIGDCLKIKDELKPKTSLEFDIVYNPEFYNYGSALNDFLHPQRIIAGTSSDSAFELLKELYRPLDAKIIRMDENSAELTKLASDCYLATKISFINEIANLAAFSNSNISSVIEGLSSDSRIGISFNDCNIGYGGASFIKNINTALKLAEKAKIDLNIIKHVKIANENQKRFFIANILKHYNYNIENKVFCIWGLTFKAQTSEMSHAPSLTIADTLSRYGAIVRAYDPKAESSCIKQYKSKEEALLTSHALIILTDWDEFFNPDFDFISKNLIDKVIFDGTNLYLNKNLDNYGLKYYYVGKNNE